MGLGGISIWQLLIILVIVIMLFGTKRLRTLGSDLGTAVTGFKNSISNDEEEDKKEETEENLGDASAEQKTAAESKDNDK